MVDGEAQSHFDPRFPAVPDPGQGLGKGPGHTPEAIIDCFQPVQADAHIGQADFLEDLALSRVIRVPLVEITARIPLDTAYSANSGRSGRMSGSPPENRITGAPKRLRSSIRIFPSSVVSSRRRFFDLGLGVAVDDTSGCTGG